MRKNIFVLVFAGFLPLSSMAQDDMYFTPSEISGNSVKKEYPNQSKYNTESNRDVDEYNRHGGKYWSHYQIIGSDSTGNDIISFQQGNGVYPDSAYIDTTLIGKYYNKLQNYEEADNNDEYYYSRRLHDYYDFYNPWIYGRWGFGPYSYYNTVGWYSPWNSLYYGYAGWYDPWYYNYYGYGWGWPYYYGNYYGREWGYEPLYTWSNGRNGARYFSGVTNRGSFGGYKHNGRTYNTESNSISSHRRSFGSSYNNNNTNNFNDRSFGNTRNSTNSFETGTRNSSSNNFGGGSFGGGGSHGGGSFGGGGSHGGGFGGHR